jgi:hypothetical protein
VTCWRKIGRQGRCCVSIRVIAYLEAVADLPAREAVDERLGVELEILPDGEPRVDRLQQDARSDEKLRPGSECALLGAKLVSSSYLLHAETITACVQSKSKIA